MSLVNKILISIFFFKLKINYWIPSMHYFLYIFLIGKVWTNVTVMIILIMLVGSLKKKKNACRDFFFGSKNACRDFSVYIYNYRFQIRSYLYKKKKGNFFFFLRRKKGLIYSTTSSTLSGTIFSTFSSFHLLAWHFFLAILLLPLILIHIVLWKNFPLNGGKIKFNW